MFEQGTDVRTDMFKELGELDMLDGGSMRVTDPYNLSLFPLRYYTPYAYNNPYVEGVQNPFLRSVAQKPVSVRWRCKHTLR
jgi:hypothetical protein